MAYTDARYGGLHGDLARSLGDSPCPARPHEAGQGRNARTKGAEGSVARSPGHGILLACSVWCAVGTVPTMPRR